MSRLTGRPDCRRNNFTHMPELDWTFGYPFAIALMISTMAGLWIFFKKAGWF